MLNPNTIAAPPPSPGRIRAIDVARGVALVAMAVYHFAWDLEFFGYVQPGLTAFGGWRLFARCIACSFLFLVGISLVLAHRRGIRWRPFLIRLFQITAAAAAITTATWIAVPEEFIFFGILHQIALATLLGVLLLRLPTLPLILLAVFFIIAPLYLRSPIFDTPLLWWVGLAEVNPRSNDYVPLFPWFGAVLFGMATAKLAMRFGWLERMRSWIPPAGLRPLEWCGRHSLAFYLVHQPVLIALVWIATQLAPPPPPDPRTGFTRACQAQCLQVRDETFCTGYCGCVIERVEQMPGGLGALDKAATDPALQTRVADIAAICTGAIEFNQLGGSNNE